MAIGENRFPVILFQYIHVAVKAAKSLYAGVKITKFQYIHVAVKGQQVFIALIAKASFNTSMLRLKLCYVK